MDTPYHSKFSLVKSTSGLYIQGKKDMFAVVIAIKYFVPKNIFNDFIDRISNLVDDYIVCIKGITRAEMLDAMNLPKNFTKLKYM